MFGQLVAHIECHWAHSHKLPIFFLFLFIPIHLRLRTVILIAYLSRIINPSKLQILLSDLLITLRRGRPHWNGCCPLRRRASPKTSANRSRRSPRCQLFFDVIPAAVAWRCRSGEQRRGFWSSPTTSRTNEQTHSLEVHNWAGALPLSLCSVPRSEFASNALRTGYRSTP